MSLKYELETAEDEIRSAFQVFDKVIKSFITSYHILLHLSLNKNKDGNGVINRHEFAVVMNNMGEKLTTEEIQVDFFL